MAGSSRAETRALRWWWTLSPNGPLGWRSKTWCHHSRQGEHSAVVMHELGWFWLEESRAGTPTSIWRVYQDRSLYFTWESSRLEWEPALLACLPLQSPWPTQFHSLPSPDSSSNRDGQSSLGVEAATGPELGKLESPNPVLKPEPAQECGHRAQQWSMGRGRGCLYILLSAITSFTDNSRHATGLVEDLPSMATPSLRFPSAGLLGRDVHHVPKCSLSCALRMMEGAVLEPVVNMDSIPVAASAMTSLATENGMQEKNAFGHPK